MKSERLAKLLPPEYLRSEYYKKVLKSFLLASCVVFMLFSMILFISANREYNTTLESVQDQIIHQAQHVNQTAVKDIVSYCYHILEDPSMQVILYGDTDANLGIEALDINRDLCHSSSLIHSSYFINFRTGTVVDQTGGWMDIAVHPDSGIYEILEGMSPTSAPTFFYPRIMKTRKASTVYYETPTLSIIFYSSSPGAMVVNLDYDLYRQLFQLDAGSHIDMLLFNSAGRVIASSDQEIFGEDLSQSELFLAASTAAGNQGTFPFTANGGNYSVSYIKNEGMGIVYVCTRENQIIYSDNGMFPPLIRFTIAALLVSFLLSLVLSRSVYDPLRRLKRTVAKSLPANTAITIDSNAPSPYQDFDYLSHVYHEIAEMNARLIRDSHARENAELFAYLLNGAQSHPASRYASRLEDLDSVFPGKNYAIILLGLDIPGGEGGLPMEEGMLKYAIQNVAHELLSKITVTKPIVVKSAFVILLINFDALDTSGLLKSIQEAQKFIFTHFHITFSAGVGDAVQELSELFQSYNGALEAFSQRFISGQSSLHTAESLCMTPADAQIYPYETAEALLGAVKSLAGADAEQFARKFLDSIKTYDIEQILSFILQLHFSLQRLEYTNYIQTVWDWSYKVLEKSTLQEIEEQLVQRCLSDIEQLASIRTVSSGASERKELIDQVKTLVEENIYNPELSVAFLADQVHLSVNYLRNIFKDSTGGSLSSYISSKKVDVICRLLTETDMTLSEINDKLGFSTRNYFYAFFKKHIGMTPGDYRKKMRQAEQDK